MKVKCDFCNNEVDEKLIFKSGNGITTNKYCPNCFKKLHPNIYHNLKQLDKILNNK